MYCVVCARRTYARRLLMLDAHGIRIVADAATAAASRLEFPLRQINLSEIMLDMDFLLLTKSPHEADMSCLTIFVMRIYIHVMRYIVISYSATLIRICMCASAMYRAPCSSIHDHDTSTKMTLGGLRLPNEMQSHGEFVPTNVLCCTNVRLHAATGATAGESEGSFCKYAK